MRDRHKKSASWMVLGLALCATSAAAQEPLTAAKTHYASAAYEEALLALSAVGPTAPAAEAVEAAAYRVFCLFALGRTDEARASVAAVVAIDPTFRPTEAQASPRVVTFFEETRAQVLADQARERFASARQSFDRGDLAEASTGFGSVLDTIAALDSAGGELADLKTLASGFRDLADRTAAQAAAPAAAQPAGVDPAEPAEAAVEPEVDRVFTDDDPDVIRPVPRARMLPQWSPKSIADSGVEFAGVIEVVIDPDGRVEAAKMLDSVHPLYDSVLLRAAADWRFKPAQKDGSPVRYRYRLGVKVGG